MPRLSVLYKTNGPRFITLIGITKKQKLTGGVPGYNNMKTIKQILPNILIVIMGYLTMAFIQAELNPFIWSKDVRIWAVLINAMGQYIYMMFKEMNKGT